MEIENTVPEEFDKLKEIIDVFYDLGYIVKNDDKFFTTTLKHLAGP